MNKKEISEIKKQFTPSRCAVTESAAAMWTVKKRKKPR